MKKIILYFLFLVVSFFPSSNVDAKRCSGGANCSACTSCNYCQHCAGGGGTCSVCSSEYSSNPLGIKNGTSKNRGIGTVGGIVIFVLGGYILLSLAGKKKEK